MWRIKKLFKGDISAYLNVIVSSIKGKPVRSFEARWKSADGSVRWGEIRVASLKKGRKITGFHAITRDITDRKNTEKAQKESEEKYRAIFESFHDVYYRTDREGLVTIISPSVRTHAGWDPEDIIGRPVTDFYKDPSERETFKEKLKESGVINDYELKLLAKDVFLDINRAIPCGLIVNELVSNSLKHAFPLKARGNIHVRLSSGNNGNVHLEVSDDGIGFSENIDFHKPDSLGLQMVNDLVKQLGGTLELDSGSGTSYQISLST